MNRQSVTQRMPATSAKPTWVSSLTSRCGPSVPTTIQPAHYKLSTCLAKRAWNKSTLRAAARSDLTAERSLQPIGAGTALEQLFHGRDVALLWDLDNVGFFAPSCSAVLQLHRMRALIELSGGRLLTCRGYFNQHTARSISGLLPFLESTDLMTCHVLPVRRDAADMGLVRDALTFVNACQGRGASSSSLPTTLSPSSSPSSLSSSSTAGAVTLGLSPSGPDEEAKEQDLVIWCVSQDAGFAAPLRHLSERGVRTVAVSPHTPGRKVHAAMHPTTYFDKLPLPAASWAALKWEPTASPVTATEATWLRELLVLTGARDGAGVRQVEVRHNRHEATGCSPTAGLESAVAVVDAGIGNQRIGEQGVTAETTTAHDRSTSRADGEGKGNVVRKCTAAAVGKASMVLAPPPPPTLAPRGLAFYGKEGVSCPGSFTHVWLNPRYCR